MKLPFWFRRLAEKRVMQYATQYATHSFPVAKTALKGICLAHLFFEHFYCYSATYGASMLPTFEVYMDGMLISRWYRRGRGVEVGDIVSFDSVAVPGESIIKRVMGLEGDYVLRYTPGSGSQEMLQVPQGHCWVTGDNLPASRDSRMFGPLPMALIQGKIIAKVFPWRERRWVENGLQQPV